MINFRWWLALSLTIKINLFLTSVQNEHQIRWYSLVEPQIRRFIHFVFEITGTNETKSQLGLHVDDIACFPVYSSIMSLFMFWCFVLFCDDGNKLNWIEFLLTLYTLYRSFSHSDYLYVHVIGTNKMTRILFVCVI